MENKNFISNIGGIFIYSKNPDKLANWYKKYLGLNFIKSNTNSHSFYYYYRFYYKEIDTGKKAWLVWAIMKSKREIVSKEKTCRLNYRVNNMEKIVKHINNLGIRIEGIKSYNGGKFVWIKDIDENLIELWEDTTLHK